MTLIWLVTIAGGFFALCSVWLFMRNTQLKERGFALNRIYEQSLADKAQLAELLSIAQKEVGSLAAEKKVLAHAQDSMKVEFRNTANQLFEEVSKKFVVQSEEKIGHILNPLRERITEFQKKVEDSFGQHGKEQHTLKAEIAKIVLQTDSLTKALKGDVKAQGNWGEIMLERILDESGLQKGRDYIVQGESMGLSGAEGNRLKPDVIINLPNGQHIIIDSKVSLTAYERYCGETDDTQRMAHLNDFIRSLKNHITGLEKKRYQDIAGLNSPEVVLMFLPVEGAFSLALQHDHELHAFAWNRKIALVCPTTLYSSLVAIASAWRVENRNRNVEEIARQAGSLYDKFAGLMDDMQKVGSQLGTVQKTYDAAMNKLSTGSGNLVGRVEKLKTLGATTTKSLPREMINSEAEEA